MLAALAFVAQEIAPWRPGARVLDAYTRNICLAVAVDGGEILSGAGGEVFRLRRESDSLALARSQAPYTLATSGVVLDIASRDDFTYVAAFRDGLRVFDRSSKGTRNAHWRAEPERQVLCVDAIDLGNSRFVAVGTESYGLARDGELHFFRHDRGSGALIELLRIDVEAPVFTVATSDNPLPHASDVALFAGTGCAADGALLRYDVAIDGDRAGVVRETGWSPRDEVGARVPAIVRDLVIDPSWPNQLYAAAFWHGVRAFDIASESGLEPIERNGWPLYLPNDPARGLGCRCETGVAHAATIAHALVLNAPSLDRIRKLDEWPNLVPERHLVVALGPARTDVSCIQSLGEHDGFFPCNSHATPREVHECKDASAQGSAQGIFAFELVDGALTSRTPIASTTGTGSRGGVGAIAAALAFAPVDATSYELYAANTGFGLHALRVERDGESWAMRRIGAWSGAAPAKLPMPAFDDALVLRGERDVLLASSEGSLAAFDLDAPTRAPLSRPWERENPQNKANPAAPWLVRDHAIMLARFDGANPRVVATTRAGAPGNPGGLAFFDVGDPARPRAAGAGELDRGGFGYGIAAARSLEGGTRRWLYTTQEVKADAKLERWSVRLWDLGTAEKPRDPGDEDGPELLATVATARDERVELGGIAVDDRSRDEQFVYALYEPREPLGGEIRWTGDVGVRVLRATRKGGTVELAEIARASAFGDATPSHRSVRLVLDGERLYAAWAGMLALGDVSKPAEPRWIARRDLRGAKGLYGLVPTPVQIALGPTIDGRSYVYVALLNGGLGVLDATTPESFADAPLHVIPTPWQTTCVLVDPRDESRRRVFVGEGTRGLEWLELR